MGGSHGRMYKQVPFEESSRVPFFLRYQKASPAGRSSNALISSIDVYPTLCGLAGIQVPTHCRGCDLSNIMRGESGVGSEVVFLMNQGAGEVEARDGAIGAAPMKLPPSEKKTATGMHLRPRQGERATEEGTRLLTFEVFVRKRTPTLLRMMADGYSSTMRWIHTTEESDR